MSSPNVLWIMSDQHNADCLGVAGHPVVKTPHLDALAAGGVQYDRAFCNNPICAPSRACFSSGQYVHNHGISGNDVYEIEPRDTQTLPEHFSRHGYQTALIGKGHLPKAWMDRGYEYQRLSDLADADANDPRSVHYFDYLVEKGLGDEFDLGTLPIGHLGHNWRSFVSKLPYEDSVEHWAGNEALSFLQDRDVRRPFMMHLSFQRPHDPIAPSVENADQYDPEMLPLPDNAVDLFERAFAGKPEFQRNYVTNQREGCPFRPNDEADLRVQLARYLALVTSIDEEIGRVIAHLRETGELENTIVIYHADHGDFAGEHGLMLKNFGIYEAVHRIPFILAWPGGPTGLVDSRMVESVDLFPTLCALANLPRPAGIDGRVVIGASGADREFSICEWDFYDQAQATTFAVRSASHRLVFYLANPDDGELYDLAADPGELTNLFSDPASADLRWRLLIVILSHIASYRRVSSPQLERIAVRGQYEGITKLLHKQGVLWSALSDLAPTVAQAPQPGSLPSVRS